MEQIYQNEIISESRKITLVPHQTEFTPPIFLPNKINIAILYIGIGKYKSFWKDFYSTCEKYFLPTSLKYYYLFTDKIDIENIHNNVNEIFQDDLGWPGNTLYRFRMFLKFKDELAKYDYIFFFNGNTLFLETINEYEILPKKNENYIVALSWLEFQKKNKIEFPYDRNKKSTAYIPNHLGNYYFQGGLNGGRSKEYIDLMIECNKQIETDEKNNVIARNHDESHLNKYLLNKQVKVLDNIYGNPEEWKHISNPKIIFRDKNNTIGKKSLDKLKKRTLLERIINKFNRIWYSFFTPNEIIFLQGGLGNQMFQYAFYLNRKKEGNKVTYDTSIITNQKQHNGYELENLFNIKPKSNIISFFILKLLLNLKKNISSIKHSYKFGIFNLMTDTTPSQYFSNFSLNKMNLYYGYWQTEKYFMDISTEVLDTFKFNVNLISPNSKLILSKIKNTNSISIHLRGGDYLSSTKNKQIYGNICTEEYYTRAIEYICSAISNPTFYIFTNDTELITKLIKTKHPIVIVNHNIGKDSWQDMFLMSQCKHNIIANSSFSWWGAWLNNNSDKIVISPSKFINSKEKSDIIPDKWIKI